MAHTRKPELVTQPSKVPTRKVANGVVTGTPLAIVLAWGLSQIGLDMPLEVAVASAALLGGLVSQAVSYFTRDRAS